MDKLQTKSEKQYYIPMEVNETSKEFIIANGYYLSTDAVWTKIGHRTVRAVMIPATKEQYLEYMRPLWREDKQGQRASRARGQANRKTKAKCSQYHWISFMRVRNTKYPMESIWKPTL